MKKKPLKLIALTLGLLLAANAQATIYEHRQYFTGDMTANQACDAAEREVRRLALSAQLGEIIQSSSFQQCLAQGDEAGRCSTQTDLYAQTPNGYVKRFDLVSRELAVTNLGQLCLVKADVEVVAFNGQPDSNFKLIADIIPGSIIRDQEEISLKISKPNGSWLYIFAGRPLKSFSLLVDGESHLTELNEFTYPGELSSVRWIVESALSIQNEERLWVIASREPIQFPSELTENQLFEQLNRAERSSWDAAPVSYTILPTEN
jgi:hypothetical protein